MSAPGVKWKSFLGSPCQQQKDLVSMAFLYLASGHLGRLEVLAGCLTTVLECPQKTLMKEGCHCGTAAGTVGFCRVKLRSHGSQGNPFSLWASLQHRIQGQHLPDHTGGSTAVCITAQENSNTLQWLWLRAA